MRGLANLRRWIVGSVLWAGLAAGVAAFSHWPGFVPIAPGHGEFKLSVAHLTERMEECEQLTAEELMALPPNMRIAERCPRERAMALLIVEANGEELLSEAIRPAGLHRGGRVYLYRDWHLPAGEYTVRVRLRDSPRSEGFDQDRVLSLVLAPGDSVLLHIGDGEPSLVSAGRAPHTAESI
jgi:hypothetical protein